MGDPPRDAPPLPVGLLHNELTGRCHPICFRPAPKASGSDVEAGALRHVSAWHHTLGFATEAEARAFVAARPCLAMTDVAYSWSGAPFRYVEHWFPLGGAA